MSVRRWPPLHLISDADGVGDERFLSAAVAAVGAGLRWIQVREPASGDARVRELIARLREALPRDVLPDVQIVLNGRPELAAELGLAGVHVGRRPPGDVGPVKLQLGAAFIVGYSAHSADEIVACGRAGADYASFSPIFGATSKRHPLPPVGIEGLERACRSSPIPVYALGGIRPERAAELRRAGASGAAVIGAILGADDPGSVVERFLAGWGPTDP